jgi:hypothetical protein
MRLAFLQIAQVVVLCTNSVDACVEHAGLQKRFLAVSLVHKWLVYNT